MQKQARHFYAFGPFRLDSRERILRRDGQPITLTLKAVDILLALVQNAEHLVEKNELMRQVWQDAFVEEGNLTKNISVLRKILGATEDGRDYIETVPRRGYRFAAQVETWLEDEERIRSSAESRFAGEASVVQPPKVERIDRGKGYALARESELIQEVQEPATVLAPSAIAGVPPSQEAGEGDSSDQKRWQTRLALGVVAALTGLAALAAVWLLSPPPAPKALRTVQLTHFGRVDGAARLVTDGARLYFMERRGGQYSLAQASVEGGEPTPVTTLVPNAQLLDMSPDHLALLVKSVTVGEEEGSLWLVPTAGGSPRRLGEVKALDAVWSPDGRTIVYSSQHDLYLEKADGTRLGKLVSTPGFPHYLKWSPDGRVLRFTLSDPISHAEALWEVTTEGRNLHRLFDGWREPPTDWGDGESGGDWTPDGRYFVFRSVRAHAASIWAIREKRGFLRWRSNAPVLLTTSDLYLWNTRMAQSGKAVLFEADKDERELERYDLRSKQFVPYLSGVSARWVSFSKDGQWAAYVTLPGFVLWRSRVDGSERLQLTFPPAQAATPRWSADGTRIAFDMGPAVSAISPDGGNPEALTAEEYHADDPEWSPDGNSLLFSRHTRDGGTDTWTLHRLDLKTRRVYPLPDSQGLRAAAFSPDGRFVAATSADPANRLMLFDVQSERWTELARANVLYVPPYWSRDGRYVYAQELAGIDQPVFRVRISDHKQEIVTTLKQFTRADVTAYSLAGLTPDDEPLASLHRSTSDIYALDVDFP